MNDPMMHLEDEPPLSMEKLERLARGQTRDQFEDKPGQAMLPFTMSGAEQDALAEETLRKIRIELERSNSRLGLVRRPG